MFWFSVNSLFLIGCLVVGAFVWGYFYTKRYGRDSGANTMWLILLGGCTSGALTRELGIGRYPQHEQMIRELDEMLFAVTVLLVIAWLFGTIFGSPEPKKNSASEIKTAPSE